MYDPISEEFNKFLDERPQYDIIDEEFWQIAVRNPVPPHRELRRIPKQYRQLGG